MRSPGFKHDAGMSLVEITLALGIVAFAFTVILGLLPVGMATLREGRMEEAATDILSTVATDMRATPATEANSPVFGIPVQGGSPEDASRFFDESGAIVQSSQEAVFQLDVVPQPGGDRAVRVWRLRVSWPATGSPAGGMVDGLFVLRRP